MTSENLIYLDNAASTFPKPRKVLQAVIQSLQSNTSNPGRSGHILSEQAAEKVFNVRCTVGAYFGCDAEHVIFTQNATHAVNMLFKGLLQPGDHVIISNMEHNCVLRPLEQLKEKGISYTCFSAQNPIEQIEDIILPKTRFIFLCHASNVTGQIIDIKKAAEIAHRHEVLFGIDASQSAGHLSYNLKQDKIDFLCTSGHKSLFGIQGSGLLLMRKDRDLDPLITGGTGVDSLSAVQPHILPEYLESGTINTPAIISLGAGIQYLQKKQEYIRKKTELLTEYLKENLQKIDGIKLYTSGENLIPTVSFAFRDIHSERIGEYLNQNKICVRGGYHCSALAHKTLQTEDTGLVRVSLSVFNQIENIDKLCYYLKKYEFS